MKIACLMAFLLAISLPALTQEKLAIKFGKLAPADFDLTRERYDTTAAAVCIADIGNTEFVGNKNGWFSTRHKRSTRIKILKKAGFQYAEFRIPLYHKGEDVEIIENLKASAYNLENGSVTETKLDSKSIFTEVYDKNLSIQKFAILGVKEGTIIEVEYQIKSDFIHTLPSWKFQADIPVLWSQYTVGIPGIFDYMSVRQGNLPFARHDTKTKRGLFSVIEKIEVNGLTTIFHNDRQLTVNTLVTEHTWIIKDAPALKKEDFTSTLENYYTRLNFQMSKIRLPETPEQDVMNTWKGLREDLMKSSDFGEELMNANQWLDAEMKNVVNLNGDAKAKARRIYNYVRDQFSCTDQQAVFVQHPLKSVWKSRKGSVSEINLILIAMLRHEMITADPVLISTREHGFVLESYPIIEQFNYVVAKVDVATDTYYLDASQPNLGFGRLPLNCYNGHARVMNEAAEAVHLNADDILEKKTTTALVNYERGKGFDATVSESYGPFESMLVRGDYQKKGNATYFKEHLLGFEDGVEILNSSVDSINQVDYPVVVKYEYILPGKMEGGLFYLNPMLTEAQTKNSFESAQRLYPVEMPYSRSETYIFTFIIPEGYDIEEMPKSERSTLNETDGRYEYLIGRNGDLIQLKSTLVLNKAVFPAEGYSNLRAFFAFVLRKQSETIVLKKKS